MTTQAQSLGYVAPQSTDRPASSVGLDWAMTLTTGWIVLGSYVDLWAHSHGKVDQSFFTPYHGLLYSGLLATILVLVFASARNVVRGYHWMSATPIGYTTALLGAALFALGGVCDMAWHTLLGIEVNFEALLSPPHLLLGCGSLLLVSGPLAASWVRAQNEQVAWLQRWPSILSATYTLAMMIFFTEYAHPVSNLLTNQLDHRSLQLGVTSMILQSSMLVAMALTLLRRWQLPFGSMMVLIGITTALISLPSDLHSAIIGAVIAGLVADGLLLVLQPRPQRVWALRLFAITVPLLVQSAYFITMSIHGELRWPVAVVSGALVLSMVAGAVVSLIAVPPMFPQIAEGK